MKGANLAVDEYIAEAAPFAQPILRRIRRIYHKASPQIVETIKWGMPHFEHHGIIGSMSAFKQHVSFGFWNAPRLPDPHGLLVNSRNTTIAMSKVKTVDELPADAVFLEYIRAAMSLNEQGVKRPVSRPRSVKKPAVPTDLKQALAKAPKARETFATLSPSCQRDYIEWLTEAKRHETRERRLTTTIEWLTTVKSRNGKYER